jgi:hypothetical protein
VRGLSQTGTFDRGISETASGHRTMGLGAPGKIIFRVIGLHKKAPLTSPGARVVWAFGLEMADTQSNPSSSD